MQYSDHQVNSQYVLILWSASLSWWDVVKQYTIGDAQSLPEISVYKSPNEVIKARVFSSKAAKHSEFPLVGISTVEVTPVANLPEV